LFSIVVVKLLLEHKNIGVMCTLTLHFYIVDGVDIKALVYVFFKKTHPRELVSKLTERNMTENLDWHGYIYAEIFFDSSYVLVI
jgi:hypothetical protein